MALNAIRLKRVKDHLENLGSAEVTKIAEILKGKPENSAYLRDFVVEAAKQLDDQSHVEDFDESVKAFLAQAAAPAPEPTPAGPATQSPPAADEIASKPAAAVKAAVPTELSPAQASKNRADQEALRLGLAPYTFRFRDENGVASDAHVTHVGKTGVVVLEKTPAIVIVEVTLKGQPQSLNLTELRQKPAGETVTIGGNDYSAATLLVIAENAQS